MIRESIEISLLIKRSNWSENILWMLEEEEKKKRYSNYLYRNSCDGLTQKRVYLYIRKSKRRKDLKPRSLTRIASL